MSRPLISLISIIYGVAPYLRQCLESLEKLDYPELELLLVVGHKETPDDGCLKIAEEFAEKDPRFRIITCLAAGAGNARNIGLREAKGEYIGFVDGDDFVDPGMFTRLYDNLVECGADISVCGKYDEYPDRTVREEFSKADSLKVMGPKEAVEMLITGGGFFFHCWDKLFKAELFKGVTFPEDRTLEDRYVIGDLIMKAERLVFDRSPLYHFRVRTDSISHTAGLCEENSHADMEFCGRMLERFPELKEKAEAYLLYGHITCVQLALAGGTFDEKSQEVHLSFIRERIRDAGKNPYINKGVRIKAFLSLYFRPLLGLWTKYSLSRQMKNKGFSKE